MLRNVHCIFKKIMRHAAYFLNLLCIRMYWLLTLFMRHHLYLKKLFMSYPLYIFNIWCTCDYAYISQRFCALILCMFVVFLRHLVYIFETFYAPACTRWTVQQLLDRLNCFAIRPAALPFLLSDRPEGQREEDAADDDDEEPAQDSEPVEDLETEELLRSMASKLSPSARYRWRRSRWLRHCPVALADGHLVPGKTEFTVS